MVQEIETLLFGEVVLTESSDLARELYNQSRFGVMDGQKVRLSLLEAYYLLEKKKNRGEGKEKSIDP